MRRLSATLFATSLLMFLSCAALWVRSHRVADSVVWVTRSGTIHAAASRGQILLLWETASEFGVAQLSRSAAPPTRDVEAELPQGLDQSWGVAGCFMVARGEMSGIGYKGVALPCWFLALIAGLPAARGLQVASRRRRRTRRRRENLCQQCGYDLRASTGVCPECGTAAAPFGAPAVPS